MHYLGVDALLRKKSRLLAQKSVLNMKCVPTSVADSQFHGSPRWKSLVYGNKASGKESNQVSAEAVFEE
jgi:hypothetical protein